jgi:hypothetical protein
MVVVPALGNVFGLTPLSLLVWALVFGAGAVWFVTLRYIWHYRLVERFVGA